MQKLLQKKKRKNNKNTIIQNDICTSHQQAKVDNFTNNDRTPIIGFSNCGKTYLMIYILIQKQEPIFIITKSLDQYPNIKAQTPGELQPLANYEKSTIAFDDMLLSKQENNNDRFFTRGRHINIDMYYLSQSYFHLPEHTIHKKPFINILFRQTPRDILLLFHDIAGLDMNLQEWKDFCSKA